MAQQKRPGIVSVQLSDEARTMLDDVCEARGMTIKSLLSKLIIWFNKLDRTEQAMVLGHVDPNDLRQLAELVMQRTAPRGKRAAKTAGQNGD
jgi:hypothetical protein